MTITNVFQYFSDIHLEHHPNQIFYIDRVNIMDDEATNVKYNLILAGDIGSPLNNNYWDFLEQVNQMFDRVFLICGNHEYYGDSIDNINNMIRNKIANQRLHNVYFLDNDYMLIDNIMIVGATLWSFIPVEARLPILQHLNDYTYIQSFTIDDCNQKFQQSKDHIARCLDKAQELNISNKIIITHHAPLMNGTSAPVYKSLTNHAFATNLDQLLEQATHWVYGHTHYNPKQPIRSNLHTNQVGYNWTNSTYNPSCFFIVL